MAELEAQFKNADLTSKLEDAEAKVVKESADLDEKIMKIEE
jgi:chromosome segregation ATPase